MSDDEELSAVEALRRQLARQEQELLHLRNEIQGLTRHDPLTGTLNRRTVVEILGRELVRSHRTGHPFSFAMIEIDRFAALCDAHGNACADPSLKIFAQASVKHLRTLDRFGRFDGARFGVLLPATWLDSGVIAMTRLRAAVGAWNWQDVAPPTPFQFSAGLTTNAPGDTPEKMVERAEKALLQAIADGGNCTSMLEDALPDMPMFDDD